MAAFIQGMVKNIGDLIKRRISRFQSVRETLVDSEKEVIFLKKARLVPLMLAYRTKALAILTFRSEK